MLLACRRTDSSHLIAYNSCEGIYESVLATCFVCNTFLKYMLFCWVAIYFGVGLFITGLMVLRSTSPQHNDRCISIMDMIDREPDLSKFAQALDVAGLAGE